MMVIKRGDQIPRYLLQEGRKTGQIADVGFYQTDQTFYYQTGAAKKGYPFYPAGDWLTIKDRRVKAYLREGLIRQIRVRTALWNYCSYFAWVSEKEDDRDGALLQFKSWQYVNIQFEQDRPYMIIRDTIRFGFMP